MTDPWSHLAFGGLVDPVQKAAAVHPLACISSISGLVAEYIVAIDVTRVRFPADAFFSLARLFFCLERLRLPFVM